MAIRAGSRKTKTPGVFKRIDGRGATVGYVAVITVADRQRKRSARTYDEARLLKRESETDRDRGELPPRATVSFLRYLDEWVERYRGAGPARLPRQHSRGIPPPHQGLCPSLLLRAPEARRGDDLQPRPLP